MEAVVIDVSQDYFSAADDDLRTDVDMEEFSFLEDQAQNILTLDDEKDFDKINNDLDRALASSVQVFDPDTPFIPKKIKKSDRQKSFTDEFKMSGEDDISQYTDASENLTQKESFKSASNGSPKDISKKREAVLLDSKKKKIRSEKSSEEVSVTDDKSPVLSKSDKRKHRKSTDSEKEDDSLREFEKLKRIGSGSSVPSQSKKDKKTDSEVEDDSLHEFENRKIGKDDSSSRGTDKKQKSISIENEKGSKGKERTAAHKKEGSSKDDGSESVDKFYSGDAISIGSKNQSTEFQTAEDMETDKSEISVLESLAHSLKVIQKGLSVVETQVMKDSKDEPLSAKGSLSLLESLTKPLMEIQMGLEVVENQITEECQEGRYSPSRTSATILETLAQPISEFQKNLAVVEQRAVLEGPTQTLLEKTTQSILENLVEPVEEMNNGISQIKRRASENIIEFKSKEATKSPSDKSVSEYSEKAQKISLPKSTTETAKAISDDNKSVQQSTLTDMSTSEPDDTLSTSTDVDEKKKLMKSISMELEELEESANLELAEYYERLMACGKVLQGKADSECDLEVRDILICTADLVNPLRKLTKITSQSISDIVENYENLGIDPSSSLVQSLTQPLEALKSSLQILESVATCETHKQIRALAIPAIYKLTVPMEELNTTVRLVENLSSNTAMEFLTAPLNNLSKAVNTIEKKIPEEGLLEQLYQEGPKVIKSLDTTFEKITNCICGVEKHYSEISTDTNKIMLKPLLKPIEEFQKLLHYTEDVIEEASKGRVSPFEIHQFVQELNKPLQAVRVEFSLLQHQIEAEHYGDVSVGSTESIHFSKMLNLIQPLEAIQEFINKFHESLVCKPPEEPMHLRYVLYGLMELNKPLNNVCNGLMKTEEAILSELRSLPKSHAQIKEVLTTVRELKEANESLRTDISKHPDVRTSMACEISFKLLEPLQQIENGLLDVMGEVSKKENVPANLSKKMSEPFRVLQKTLVSIEDEILSKMRTEHSASELKQSLQGVQSSILAIQDKFSFEYGDESSSIQSNVDLLQSLVQPMNILKQTFSDIHSLTEKSICDISRCKASLETVSESSDLLLSQITVLGKLFGKDDITTTVLKPLQIILGHISNSSKDANNYISSIDKTITTSTRDSIKNSFRSFENDLDKLNVRCSIGLKNCNRDEFNTLKQLGQLINDLTGALSTCVKKFGQNQSDDDKFNKDFTVSLEKLSKKMKHCENKLVETTNEILTTKGPLHEIKTKGVDNVDDEISESMVKLRTNFNSHIEEIRSIRSTSSNPLIDKMKNDIEHLSTLINVSKSVSGDKINVYERIAALARQAEADLKMIETDVHHGSCNLTSFIFCLEAVKKLSAILSGNEKDSKAESITASVESLGQNLTCLKTNLKKEVKTIHEDEIKEMEKKVDILKKMSMDEVKTNANGIKATINNIKENLTVLSKDAKIGSCDSIVKDALMSCEQIKNIVKETNQGSSTEELCSLQELAVIKNTVTTISNMNSHFVKTSDQQERNTVLKEFLNKYEKAAVSLGESILETAESSKEAKMSQLVSNANTMMKLVSSIQKSVSEQEKLKFEKIAPLLDTLQESTSAIQSLVGETSKDAQALSLSKALQNIITPLRVLHSVIQSDKSLAEVTTSQQSETVKTDINKSKSLITQFAKASSDLGEEFSKLEESLKLPVTKTQAAIVTKVESLLTPVTLLTEYVDALPDFDSDSESMYDKSNISILKTLAEPVQEIKKAVIKIQEQVALEAAGKLTIEKSKQLLTALATPIKELKANIALIQEQANILSASDSSLTEFSYHKTVAKELVQLKEAVTGMVQSGLLECVSIKTEHVPKKEALTKLLEEIQCQLVNINEQEILEPQVGTLSVKDTINQIARPVYELQKELAFVQEQEPLSYLENVPEKSNFETIAKSLFEVCKNVVEVIENKFFEIVDSDENTIQSDLPTLASTTEYNYEKGVAKIEENIVVIQDVSSEAEKTVFTSKESGIDTSGKGLSASNSEKSIDEESGIDGKISQKEEITSFKSQEVTEHKLEIEKSKSISINLPQGSDGKLENIAAENVTVDECNSEVFEVKHMVTTDLTKPCVVQPTEFAAAETMPAVQIHHHKESETLGLIEEEISEESDKTVSDQSNNSVIEGKPVKQESAIITEIKQERMKDEKEEKDVRAKEQKEIKARELKQIEEKGTKEMRGTREENEKKAKELKENEEKEKKETAEKERKAKEQKEKEEKEKKEMEEKGRKAKELKEKEVKEERERKANEQKEKEEKEMKEKDEKERMAKQLKEKEEKGIKDGKERKVKDKSEIDEVKKKKEDNEKKAKDLAFQKKDEDVVDESKAKCSAGEIKMDIESPAGLTINDTEAAKRTENGRLSTEIKERVDIDYRDALSQKTTTDKEIMQMVDMGTAVNKEILKGERTKPDSIAADTKLSEAIRKRDTVHELESNQYSLDYGSKAIGSYEKINSLRYDRERKYDSFSRPWKAQDYSSSSQSLNTSSSEELGHTSRISAIGGPLRKAYSSDFTLDSYNPKRSVHLGSAACDVDPSSVGRRTDYLGKSRFDSRLDTISSLGELSQYSSRYHTPAMHLGPIRPTSNKYSRSYEHIRSTEDLDFRRSSRDVSFFLFSILKSVVLKLVRCTEPHQYHMPIHRTPLN